MKYISKTYHDFMRFADRNPEYLFCSLIYYLVAVWWFGWDSWTVRIVLALLYILSLMIAFSSLGEKLLRLFSNIRRLETTQEKERLLPLFDEVLRTAKAENPEFAEHDVILFIQDKMTVNAFAIGKRTVAVTKGAIQTFSDEELKAVFAHEIAHIWHMDTMARIYTLIGNGIFTFCILTIKLIGWILSRIRALESAVHFVDTLFNGLVYIFLFLMQIATSVRDRKAERRADNYAIMLGYGEDMVSALYLLEKISLSGECSIVEKLLASHPRVTSRIEALELQLGIQKKEDYDHTVPNQLSLGEIFDKLDGKTYGESWDMLKLCNKDVVESVAKNCPHDNAKSAAGAILDEDISVESSIVVALVAIATIIIIVATVFWASNFISDWLIRRDEIINMTETTSEPEPTVIPTETSVEQLPTINAETENIPVKDISIFQSNDFAAPDGTSEEIINLLNSGGEFGLYILSANISDDKNKNALALDRFNKKFDPNDIIGDPEILHNWWVTSLDGSEWPTKGVTVILTPPVEGGFPSGAIMKEVLLDDTQAIALFEDNAIGVVTLFHCEE